MQDSFHHFNKLNKQVSMKERRDENRGPVAFYPTWQLLNLILGAIKLNWVLLLEERYF